MPGGYKKICSFGRQNETQVIDLGFLFMNEDNSHDP